MKEIVFPMAAFCHVLQKFKMSEKHGSLLDKFNYRLDFFFPQFRIFSTLYWIVESLPKIWWKFCSTCWDKHIRPRCS